MAKAETVKNLSVNQVRKLMVGPVRKYALYLSLELGKLEVQMREEAEQLGKKVTAAENSVGDYFTAMAALERCTEATSRIGGFLRARAVLCDAAEAFAESLGMHPAQMGMAISVDAEAQLDKWKAEEKLRKKKDRADFAQMMKNR